MDLFFFFVFKAVKGGKHGKFGSNNIFTSDYDGSGAVYRTTARR
jgi:hypothetical protein